ncbi:MAG: DNA mismatch repair endonuclease MutL [Chloroflexi bacterium]|nr:MAG: DNA mismatch repair endonuclease MutL [Chloroflexota bacterium]
MRALDQQPAVARIEALAPDVADAIAAGEVIDRPAAVVKELIENAVDAGATRIAVRVEGAGRQLIEVVDDGRGILPEDLAIAFRRHATSKVRSLADLGALSTLGFRGEALASIAAVAEVEAVSRARGRDEGRRLWLAAGAIREEGAAPSPGGTRISVRRLFFNTPARLQFLKQPSTESAAMVRATSDLALAHPEIAIQLRLEGRSALETPGVNDLRAVVAAVYDAALAAAMLQVDHSGVSGLLAPPSVHRATRDHVVLMVNRRRIHHRNLVYAVEQAYRGLRQQDRFPIAVLDLRLDPSLVDVNVHPTKREVRFRNEGAVFSAVERACFHALRASPLYQLETAGGGLQLRESSPWALPLAPGSDSARVDSPAQPVGLAGVVRPELPALSYRAQVLNAYLVAQAPGALVLVDQHAAHERVLFDRIRRRLAEGGRSTQLALVPEVVELSPAQLAAFEAQPDFLRSIGFEAEPFGPHSVRITAVPLELPASEVVGVFERVLGDLEGERTPDRRLHEVAALLACHSAVRFGDALTRESAEELLSLLAATEEPISCPHGRPTTLVLRDDQLRRLFKRP